MTSSVLYSPLVYKQRYEQLPVRLASGSTTTVSIKNYVNAGIAQFYNPATRNAFTAKLNATGVDIDLFVDSGSGMQQIDKSSINLPLLVAYAFVGKGAPEHCQIVLQLADHWNLAPSGLQAYADTALGLDCNGFVGNFLWHTVGKSPHAWTNVGVGKHDTDGPDTGISGYLDHRRKINRWDELRPGRCYILGRTDAAGNVIDKVAGTDSAHIAITEPSLFGYTTPGGVDALDYKLDDAPLSWGFRPDRLRTSPRPGPLGRDGPSLGDPSLGAIFVVESTASAQPPGLSASWYRLQGRMRGHVPGVFDLYRESMSAHKRLWFQIAEIG